MWATKIEAEHDRIEIVSYWAMMPVVSALAGSCHPQSMHII